MNVFSFAQVNNLKPGDVLTGPKSQFQIVNHFIVYRGQDHCGNEIYMDNNVKEGVRRLYEPQMLRENPSQLQVRRFIGDEYQRALAMQRADSLHCKPYHLTKFNCEHFANYVQHNTPFSQQVDNGSVGLGVAASFIALVGIMSFIFGE